MTPVSDVETPAADLAIGEVQRMRAFEAEAAAKRAAYEAHRREWAAAVGKVGR